MEVKRVLLIMAAVAAANYYNWNKKGPNSKTNRTQERPSGKSSIKKTSTSWLSKDISDSSESSHLSEKKSTSLKVYVRGRCRTGNNVFQYVSALGIAHHNNRSVVFNPEMIKLKAIFPKTEVKFLNDPPEWEKLVEIGPNRFDPQFFNLPQKNITIGTFFQSFKYFEDIFGDIYNKTLSYFDESMLTAARRFIDKAKRDYKQRKKIGIKETKITSVCVHARRGDFVSISSFIVPSSLDIQNAMNYMQNKFKHTVLIVISNDIKWCAGNLNRSNVYFSNLTSANEDFVLMCSCDHMIMTVGTFGWWGAWFTSWRGGISMYYAHLFSRNSLLYKAMNRHDWFPPHWVAYTNMTIIESKYLGDR